MTFWYLGTPYTKFPGGLHKAFVAACREQAVLISAGIPVFCPITHTHPVAVHANLNPTDLGIWLPVDRPFIDAACGLIICELPSWEISVGIEEERKLFVAAGKPVVHMTPGQVPEL